MLLSHSPLVWNLKTPRDCSNALSKSFKTKWKNTTYIHIYSLFWGDMFIDTKQKTLDAFFIVDCIIYIYKYLWMGRWHYRKKCFRCHLHGNLHNPFKSFSFVIMFGPGWGYSRTPFNPTWLYMVAKLQHPAVAQVISFQFTTSPWERII